MFVIKNPRHKVWLGNLIIAIAGFFLFVFALTFIIGLFGERDDTKSIIYLFIPCLMSAFALTYAISLKRQAKWQMTPPQTRVDPSVKLDLTSQLTAGIYKKVTLELIYKTFILRYVFLLGLCMLLSYWAAEKSEDFLLYAGLSFTLIPFSSYFLAAKNFKSNKMLHEKVTYTIDMNEIHTTGETYSSKFLWSSLHKVRELSHVYLLYTSNRTALFLSKKNMSPTENDIFKDIVLAHEGIMKEFKV